MRAADRGDAGRGECTLQADVAACESLLLPAPAGKTVTLAVTLDPTAVHPRAGGERSSQKRLIPHAFHDVKERTDVPGSFGSGCGTTLRCKCYQIEAVEIHGHATVAAARIEAQPRVGRRRPGDHGVAVVGAPLGSLIPPVKHGLVGSAAAG